MKQYEKKVKNMKLSQMINTKEENIAKDAGENSDQEQHDDEISADDKAEMDALIAIGIPRIVTSKSVYELDIDDNTKAELAELKSFAGI